MRKKFISHGEFITVILLVISTIPFPAIAGDEIRLKSRRFTPAKGISAATKAKIEAVPGKAHVLIQLERIPTIRERKELGAKGIELLSYVPDKAWFASIPSDKTDEISVLSSIRSISEILPDDKINHSVKEKGVNDYSTNATGEAKLTVLFFDDVSLNDAAAIVSNYGGTVTGSAPIINALVIFLPKDLIHELASHDSVRWINQHYEPAIANDGARDAIGVDIVQTPSYNLTGTSVVAGEWDGGCVDNTHGDLVGRVTQRNCAGSYPDHATHVAGTLLGDGARSEAEGGMPLQWRGMATNATVISYLWWYSVDELYSDYADAINTYGIDLSTNSWGYLDWDCEYDLYTQAEDEVVAGACGKRIPIVWAAGNEGDDYGWMSFRSNAVAKNIITVGATNSNEDSLAYFSSLGPTSDGRVKPDVVAPGCQVGGDGGIKSTVLYNKTSAK